MADRAARDGRAAIEVSKPLQADAVRGLAADRRVWAGLGLIVTIATVFLVYVPVLNDQYFYGDDFVPFADIATNSVPGYLKDLFLMDDLTPNWRFLAGVYYLLVYEIAGLNSFAYLMGSVLAHVATAGLVFWLVWRALDRVWPATFAGLLFGLSAATVPTVGQVTAFNNVLAGLMITLSVVAMYEAYEPGRRFWLWVAGSGLAFLGAVASNESTAVLAIVPALVALWRSSEREEWRSDRDELVRLGSVWAAFGAMGVMALASFAACGCTEASREGVFGTGSHMWSNVWVYLGRLVYPADTIEAPGKVNEAHLAAGIALAVVLGLAFVVGPNLGRVAAAFLIVALLPYLPLEFALAPRYVYLASIPFAVLGGVFLFHLLRLGGRLSPSVATAVVALALAALALNAWQSWVKSDDFVALGEDWEQLVEGLEREYPALPPESRVHIRGGPATRGEWQFYVLPAVGDVLWANESVVDAVHRDASTVCGAASGETHVISHDAGRYTPLRTTTVRDLTSLTAVLIEGACPPRFQE